MRSPDFDLELVERSLLDIFELLASIDDLVEFDRACVAVGDLFQAGRGHIAQLRAERLRAFQNAGWKRREMAAALGLSMGRIDQLLSPSLGVKDRGQPSDGGDK